MTELACHQLQIGSWALRKIPEKVMGHGAITYWKDGRDVYDNVSCVYVFDDGVKMTFDSVISNKFYGLEEQIMGNLGTVEPEKGKYYFESVAPAPAFLQMVNDWETKYLTLCLLPEQAGRRKQQTKTKENSLSENVPRAMVHHCCWKLLLRPS